MDNKIRPNPSQIAALAALAIGESATVNGWEIQKTDEDTYHAGATIQASETHNERSTPYSWGYRMTLVGTLDDIRRKGCEMEYVRFTD